MIRTLLIYWLLALSCWGADWFISPTSTGGSGTLNSPGTLSNAIAGTGWASSIAAGDTMWLRGGSGNGYLGGPLLHSGTPPNDFNTVPWTVAVSGTANALITWRSYTNEWAVIGGEWNWNTALYNRYRDLEFYDPYKGFNPTNSCCPNGPWAQFNAQSTHNGNEFINCVIHDVDNCFSAGGPSTVRGCIFWYVGVNPLDHLSYGCVSNFTGNICLFDATDTINGAGDVHYSIFQSNVFAGVGDIIGPTWGGSEIRLGLATNTVVSRNYFYERQTAFPNPLCLNVGGLGDGTGVTLEVTSNVLVGTFAYYAQSSLGIGTTIFSNNICYNILPTAGVATILRNDFRGVTYWDNNEYYSLSPNTVAFAYTNSGANLTFSQWKSQIGYDTHSTATNGLPPANAVYVVGNQDAAKRCHVAVYNYTSNDNVTVNLIGILSSGDIYTVKNAQDYNGPAVQTGTFNGSTINLPMTNLNVSPLVYGTNWSLVTPSPLSPEFGAFVVIGSAPTGTRVSGLIFSGGVLR